MRSVATEGTRAPKVRADYELITTMDGVTTLVTGTSDVWMTRGSHRELTT